MNLVLYLISFIPITMMILRRPRPETVDFVTVLSAIALIVLTREPWAAAFWGALGAWCATDLYRGARCVRDSSRVSPYR